MKIKYFSLKGGFPLNPPLMPVWFTDCTWAKPEVNRAAYDLFIMRTLMAFKFLVDM